MSRNRYISPVFSSVLKATLRDSSLFLFEMLCSEFIWWFFSSECGITQSGLNFLSLCGCWGLWRPAKTLLFVCMWQGLICYSIYLFILFCQLGSGFAFFPVPAGSACPQPKTISTTNQIPRYSQSNSWVVCITKKPSVLQQIVCGWTHSLICVLDFAFLPQCSALFLSPGAARFVPLQCNSWDQLTGNTIFQMWPTVLVDHVASRETW